MLPNADLSKMRVEVKLGVPHEFIGSVDVERVKQQFPYGTVNVVIEVGGLACSSGIILPEQGDAPEDDRAIAVVAAVSVFV